MLKINFSGSPIRVPLFGGAALICKPFDVMDVHWALGSEPCEFGDLDAPADPADVSLEALGRTMRNAHYRLAMRVVTGFEGIGDEDGDEVAFSEEALAAIMRDPRVYGRFVQHYGNTAFGLAEEGNDSAPSPNGTSAAAQTSASRASISTSGSATSARSGKTARNRLPAKRSGA